MYAFYIQTGAIITDLDIDLSTFVKGAQHEASRWVLSPFHAIFGKFDAMVHGIAHQMSERILDCLDDGLVEFRLFALHLDGHFLAATERDVAHRPRKLAPDVSDGLHAGLHDHFLQFGGDQVQTLGGGQKGSVFCAAGEEQDLVAR